MYLRKCKTKFPPFAPKISLTNKTCKSIMSYHLSYSNQLKTCQKPVFFKSNLLVEKLSCPRWLDRFFIWALVWVWRIHNRWGKKKQILWDWWPWVGYIKIVKLMFEWIWSCILHLCPEMNTMAKMTNLARFCLGFKCDKCGKILLHSPILLFPLNLVLSSDPSFSLILSNLELWQNFTEFANFVTSCISGHVHCQ